MNQMEIFKNTEFGGIRVIEENGKCLFCGLDVTAVLGYKDSAKAMKVHCTSDGWAFYPLIDNVGRTQKIRFISEGNLYHLIAHSKLPYTKPDNDGLFTVKDYCNHGHTGSYTLVTPQGKLFFAQLRDSILLMNRASVRAGKAEPIQRTD